MPRNVFSLKARDRVTGAYAIAAPALLFAVMAVPGFGQANTAPKQDEYRLTMDKLKRTFQAYKNVFVAMAADRRLLERFKAQHNKLEDAEDTSGRDLFSLTFGQMISSEPQVVVAFSKAGITPKEAGMAMEALIGAMLGTAILDHQGVKADLPKGLVADTYAFYRQNKEQIMALWEDFGKAAQELGLGLGHQKDEKDEEEEEEEEEKDPEP